MMALARYTVVVPKVDHQGNPLRDVAQAVHHLLSYSSPMQTRHAYIDGGKRGAYDHDVVVAHAEEHPKHDSYMKQMAGYIGDVTNHPVIHATKTGQKGMQAWDIANRLFRPGEPAEDLVLQPLLAAGGAPGALPGLDGAPDPMSVIKPDGTPSGPGQSGHPAPAAPTPLDG